MPVEEWYSQLPPITRSYVTLSVLTTAGCAMEIITPFNVYYNTQLIFRKMELWRLVTNFLYFGSLGLDFVFHMFFLLKYSKALEEGASVLMLIAPFANVQFLGASLTYMMVYVWSRRHPYVQLSFLGIITFTAPYLPWVLLGFTVMLGSSPIVDLLGMVAGHIYYFLEDVYPQMSGRRLLSTPSIIKALLPQNDVGVAVGEAQPEPQNPPPPPPPPAQAQQDRLDRPHAD